MYTLPNRGVSIRDAIGKSQYIVKKQIESDQLFKSIVGTHIEVDVRYHNNKFFVIINDSYSNNTKMSDITEPNLSDERVIKVLNKLDIDAVYVYTHSNYRTFTIIDNNLLYCCLDNVRECCLYGPDKVSKVKAVHISKLGLDKDATYGQVFGTPDDDNMTYIYDDVDPVICTI